MAGWGKKESALPTHAPQDDACPYDQVQRKHNIVAALKKVLLLQWQQPCVLPQQLLLLQQLLPLLSLLQVPLHATACDAP